MERDNGDVEQEIREYQSEFQKQRDELNRIKMNPWLDYIKETGKEISTLNDEIKKEKEENKALLKKITKLEKIIATKDNEYKHLIKLANFWRADYERIRCEYDNLNTKYDALAMAVSILAPKFKEKFDEDVDDDLFSKVLTKCARCSWW